MYKIIFFTLVGVSSIIGAPRSARVRRDNEIYDINLLPGHQVQLTVPAVAQTLQYTCGPTIALAMQRYWGYRGTANDMDGPITGNLCADGLYMRMITHGFTDGTPPTNFVTEINRRIVRNYYNSGRRYSIMYLQPSTFNPDPNIARSDYSQHANYMSFARLVYNSLINNAPVALGFRGRIGNREATLRDHFILITGVTITEFQGATFSYMDPDGGVHRTMQSYELNRILHGGGVLIYHTPTGFYQPPTTTARPVTPQPGRGPGGGDEDRCLKNVSIGSAAGTSTGMLAGAVIGSAFPGPGTIIGGFVGALVGTATGVGAGAAAGC